MALKVGEGLTPGSSRPTTTIKCGNTVVWPQMDGCHIRQCKRVGGVLVSQSSSPNALAASCTPSSKAHSLARSSRG